MGLPRMQDRTWISCVCLVRGVESSLRLGFTRTKGVSVMRLEAPEKGSQDLTTPWGTELDSISLSLEGGKGSRTRVIFFFSFFHTDNSFQKCNPHEQNRTLVPPL